VSRGARRFLCEKRARTGPLAGLEVSVVGADPAIRRAPSDPAVLGASELIAVVLVGDAADLAANRAQVGCALRGHGSPRLQTSLLIKRRAEVTCW
jgi:hypothetical protein